MKNLINFFKFSLFAMSVLVLTNCSEDEPAVDDPGAPQLAATAALTAISGTDPQVQKPAEATDLDWTGFTLKFNENKSYSTSGIPEGGESVWPANGTWAWADATTVTKITRGDGVPMTVTASTDGKLTINFTIDTSAGRTAVVDGAWGFVFTAP
jgi:hypothetical protein